MATQPAPPLQFPSKRNALIRRLSPDTSQRTRHIVQGLFLLLNGWIGIQFYLWARYFERSGTGLNVSRPAGVEGWLPIAGMMNTKYLFTTGRVPAIHPAAMFLFIGFMLMSLLVKKAFCSWLCPVGTFSELLWRIGRRFFGRNLHLPRWFDIPLRGLKYVLLALFVIVIGTMSAAALDDFMATPYGLVADVKMLNFFRDIGITAVVVVGLLGLLSMLIQNFWCRYLCPYGALMGLASLLSPLKIRRDTDACIDCNKCAKACPAGLAVDQFVQIRTVECTACMACISVCPAENALQLALPPRQAATATERWRRRSVTPIAVCAVLAYLFFGVVLFARATNHWQTNIPQQVYMDLVPRANQLTHPGM